MTRTGNLVPLLLLLVVSLGVSRGRAEQVAIPECAPHSEMIAAIAKADEERVSAGIWGQLVIEVFASKAGATWTIIATDKANGLSCVKAVGTNWQMESPAVGGQDASFIAMRDCTTERQVRGTLEFLSGERAIGVGWLDSGKHYAEFTLAPDGSWSFVIGDGTCSVITYAGTGWVAFDEAEIGKR